MTRPKLIQYRQPVKVKKNLRISVAIIYFVYILCHIKNFTTATIKRKLHEESCRVSSKKYSSKLTFRNAIQLKARENQCTCHCVINLVRCSRWFVDVFTYQYHVICHVYDVGCIQFAWNWLWRRNVFCKDARYVFRLMLFYFSVAQDEQVKDRSFV